MIGFITIPRVADGQKVTFPVSYEDPGACTASIPSSAMTRVGVYMSVDIRVPADSNAKLVIPPALALSRAAVAHVREMLGATVGQVPSGEPVTTWRDAEGALRITARRTGGLSVASNPDREPSSSGIGGGLLLLESGLTSAINAGAKLEWPAAVTSDSLVFDLQLDADSPDKSGQVKSREGQEPIFTVMMPWLEQTRVTRAPRISYPRTNIGRGLEGYLHLTFVVDTAGRAEVETVRDIWPIGRPRLTGEMGIYYDAFLEAIRKGLPSARFAPARLGGCPVKIWVQQSFEFRQKKPTPTPWPPEPAPATWPPP